MSVLIKNGRVITAVDDYHADIFIEHETVSIIGRQLDMEADTVIDAAGKYLFPGGLDPHTHLDMPFGGTTTLIDFAIQTKGESSLAALETWHEKAEGKTAIDYGFHMIITDLEDDRLWEMKHLADEGITSYKLFMAYPGVLYVDDGTIYRAMRQAGDDGTVICMHAENGIVIDEIVKHALARGETEPKHHALTRPTRMEAEGTHRAISIARARGSSASRCWRAASATACAWPTSISAQSRRAGVGGNLPAIPVPGSFLLRAGGLRRRQVRDDAAAARALESG